MDDESAGLLEHHRYHHHGGVTLLVAMSLDTLGVAPDQRSVVEQIRRDLLARLDPARTAEQHLAIVLADGVATSSLDVDAANGAVAQLVTVSAAIPQASAALLNQLHGVLTPVQRSTLIDKVLSHWAVWRQANDDATGAPESPRGSAGALVLDLGLTADQADRVTAALHQASSLRLDTLQVSNYLQTFGDAFRRETFEANDLVAAGAASAQMVSWGAAHFARVVETLSPVLTVDQRARFAQMLREHATHNPSS
jgi:hypothetical protein